MTFYAVEFDFPINSSVEPGAMVGSVHVFNDPRERAKWCSCGGPVGDAGERLPVELVRVAWATRERPEGEA